jgi:hypothetical protein
MLHEIIYIYHTVVKVRKYIKKIVETEKIETLKNKHINIFSYLYMTAHFLALVQTFQ